MVSQATPYVFQIAVASQAGTLATVVTDPVYVTTAGDAGGRRLLPGAAGSEPARRHRLDAVRRPGDQ